MPKEKVSVYNLLRRKYPEIECVLISEVSDTTGVRNRSCDHMVINLWPSRGNAIIGFEVKSWRNDWLRELKDPNKQEAIFKYCDYFYLLTDVDDVAKLEEIPQTWGWMHVKGNSLKTMKEAPKLNPVPLSKQFVCAMLRRAATKEKYVHIDSIQDRINDEIIRREAVSKRENEWKLSQYDKLAEEVEAFEKASGLQIKNGWGYNAKKCGEAVKVLMNGGADNVEKRLISLKESTQQILKEINNKIKLLNGKETSNTEMD